MQNIKQSNFRETMMQAIFFLSALISVLAVLAICLFLFMRGIPAIAEIGFLDFIFNERWGPTNTPASYGILSMIVGSIYVTAGAIVIGVPIGLMCAIFLAEFCPNNIHKTIKHAVNLLAGIPSIIYGFFGMEVIVPFVRENMGGNGYSIMSASTILGIMILPTIISISESSIRAVPESYAEGSYGLGATKEETIFKVVVPAAKSGILTSIILGIGRAIGETMAVVITAKKILKPINEMTKSLDDMLEEESKINMKIYEEFEPLSNTIKDQKNKINEYINELKFERDNISFITSNMKEGFILLNYNKDILSINKSGKIMIGNESFELKGSRNILELTRSPEIIEKINTSIKENKHLKHDVETSDKCYRYYFSPVLEQSKTIKGLLILIEDITIQKKSEIMRSEFTANVSHELKTPLTTMIGFAEMIKEGLITGEGIEKYSALIHKEGIRLISLIEDLMRLSKIQEHTENVEEELISIKDISEDVVNLLKSKAENYSVKLILNADDVVMKANNNYINELLYNLIDNGIKYNKDGGSVNIRIYEEDGAANIVVIDTGVGIPPEHIDRIFERFYRVDKSRSKETGGTGLGLSIVKHITELYDGTIDIKSSNIGTRIIIKLPV